jgi:hypothetical protein
MGHGPDFCRDVGAVGQFLAIRGDMDGETLLGYYSPITRPDDEVGN